MSRSFNRSINVKGKLLDLDRPLVMGILNVTPDSFYDGGRYTQTDTALEQVEKMLTEGADIIDIGGMSSRPGAAVISSEEECRRVLPIIEACMLKYPDSILSIDTVYGASVRRCAEAGVSIINDISGGSLSSDMLDAVAESGLPYILMHMKGRPETMQSDTQYDDILLDVSVYLRNQVVQLRQRGIKDIIIDPGFGFGKSLDANYTLLRHLSALRWIDAPILVGLSRKSMIYKSLQIEASQALNATTALHMAALIHGASILRVHDVKEAVEVVHLYQKLYPTDTL